MKRVETWNFLEKVVRNVQKCQKWSWVPEGGSPGIEEKAGFWKLSPVTNKKVCFFEFSDVTGTGVSLEYTTDTPPGPPQNPHWVWYRKKWSFFRAPTMAGMAEFDEFCKKVNFFGQFINFLAHWSMFWLKVSENWLKIPKGSILTNLYIHGVRQILKVFLFLEQRVGLRQKNLYFV